MHGAALGANLSSVHAGGWPGVGVEMPPLVGALPTGDEDALPGWRRSPE
ncbi:hypothetical protein [Dactylosporangium sp. CA-092794]